MTWVLLIVFLQPELQVRVLSFPTVEACEERRDRVLTALRPPGVVADAWCAPERPA